ncbi:MAG: ribonuclease P protein component [Buchnera aphidicola (Periphyllus acericola)]|uniref:ribonuclease P protein component n=1 Tax=Buchnera aphidicola TaxID=9 RepID=UPI0030D47FF3|nr:ribonuclease P protein component [Buchnera aphidicola (Periphyllus acericola)]
MIKYSLNKNFRLLTSRQYKFVLKNSYKVQFNEIIILGRVNNFNYPRLGISISKQNVRNSVERNYIKRLVREFFRVHKNNLLLMDYVVIVKKKIFRYKNRIFLNKLKYLWSRYFFNLKN